MTSRAIISSVIYKVPRVGGLSSRTLSSSGRSTCLPAQNRTSVTAFSFADRQLSLVRTSGSVLRVSSNSSSATFRNYSSIVSVNCSKCAHSYSNDQNISDFVSQVTCPKCGALQKRNLPELPDYFSILGHTKSYRVDLQNVANKTKQLQKRFHPDLYSQKGSEQQNLSQEYSSLVNKALYTLLDPIARGRYMLTLAGLSPEDPDGDLERTMTSDPEFLEEVMELNERLEEINSEGDWKDFRNQNEETLKEIHEELEKAFEKGEIKEAQRLLGRMKYFDTLQHKLKDLQSRIGVVE
ncbi:Iron-sulfur cluster co-chaperone protein HscB, mitochondrial [Orchesella cincta]|uniref:Iron-sulfur cluster co-chaperone protein HscB, mitochondrial n=1 Tax=Orchesella cincta TaxID=48709 RepID=A0A1D2N776_ORCCI|nr:Iron-sulfur cluster co-chaperone protein HscB, mitochondrial [Orchesella cincta]